VGPHAGKRHVICLAKGLWDTVCCALKTALHGARGGDCRQFGEEDWFRGRSGPKGGGDPRGPKVGRKKSSRVVWRSEEFSSKEGELMFFRLAPKKKTVRSAISGAIFLGEKTIDGGLAQKRGKNIGPY